MLVGFLSQLLLAVLRDAVENVLAQLSDIARLILLVDDVRDALLLRTARIGRHGVVVHLVVEEVLQEMVLKANVEVLEAAALVVVKHAVELWYGGVAVLAVPVGDRVNVLVWTRVVLGFLFRQRLGAAEASMQIWFVLRFAVEEGKRLRDECVAREAIGGVALV